MAVVDEEWPDVISVEPEVHEEYGRISEAVGELTSAVLDCKMKKLMEPGIAKNLRDYLTAILHNLDEGIDW